MRGLARAAAGYLLSTLVTALLIVIAILAAVKLTDDVTWPFLVGLAFLLAIIYQIGRPWTEKHITQLVANQGHDPAAIVETYAAAIGHILEIETLADVAIATIRKILRIRHGTLILVTGVDNTGVMQLVGGTEGIPEEPDGFFRQGPLLSYFVERRQPLLQYDLDVLPEYGSLDKTQRGWLSALRSGRLCADHLGRRVDWFAGDWSHDDRRPISRPRTQIAPTAGRPDSRCPHQRPTL